MTYDGNISLVKNYPYLDMLDAPSYMKYVNAFGREQYMHDHNMGAYGSAAYDNGFLMFSQTAILLQRKPRIGVTLY